MSTEASQVEWNPLDVDWFEFEHNDPELCCRVVDKDDWDKLVDLWNKTVMKSAILQSSYNATRAELEELKRTTDVRAVPRFHDEDRFPASFQPKRLPDGTEIGPMVK